MNRMKKRCGGLLLVLTLLFSLVLAVPVSADMTEDEESQLVETVDSFLGSAFGQDEETYDSVREQGGFYEVMVDAIRDNQETLGALTELQETSVETSDDAVTTKTQAEFENYDAEIVLTFDETGTTPRNFVINVDYPMSVKMGQAGKNTLIGLLVVFLVLVFLSGVISLMKYVNPEIRKGAGKSGQDAGEAGKAAAGQSGQAQAAGQAAGNAKAASPATASAVSSAAGVSVQGVSGAADEGEILAVIAAAIAAAEADSLSQGGYVVRSIKKVNTSRRWKRA